MSSGRPLLLLDVDGVLNPFAAPACPARYREYDLFADEDPVRLCDQHGAWIQELAGRFELVWATAWGQTANEILAPLLRLPELPVIEFPPLPIHARDKVPAIAAYVGRQPAIWLDDALTPEAYEWACTRDAPTLLIDIDPAEGLTRRVVDAALHWANQLALRFPVGRGR